jgi:hypothetical protein
MDDAEYDAYVLARWPALVRAAVGLGCDAEEPGFRLRMPTAGRFSS